MRLSLGCCIGSNTFDPYYGNGAFSRLQHWVDRGRPLRGTCDRCIGAITFDPYGNDAFSGLWHGADRGRPLREDVSGYRRGGSGSARRYTRMNPVRQIAR